MSSMDRASFISRDLEQRRGALVRRGVATLIVLGLVLAGFVAAQNGMFTDRVEVEAQLDDVGGALVAGSDVKLRGAIVGRVSSIATHDGGVRLRLSIDPEEAARLPAGVTARVLPATIFGTAFIDLVPPARPQGTLQAETVIGQDPSDETRELQDALDSSYEILTAIEPARLSVTLGALAEALDGRGASLGETIDTLDTYLTRLEPLLPQVREDLAMLGTNLTTIAQIAPELLGAVENSFVTTQTIVERQDDLAQVLSGGGALVDETQVLLADNQQPFIKAMTQSAPIVTTLYDQRAGFTQTFDALVELATIGKTSFTDPDAGASSGGMLNTLVEIVVNLDQPYTAADCPVFGPPEYRAVADTCGGSAPAATQDVPAPGLVAQIQGLLVQLEAVSAADPNGVGDLLTRGFVPGEVAP